MKITRSFVLAVALLASVVTSHADAPLRKGDQFDLRIGGVPGDEMSLISSNYTVDGEGCINLSYIGKVEIEGKTASQSQSAIERTYIDRGIFSHPTVTITVAQATRLITVGGEVNNKGRIPYTPDMTLLTAIGAAGDFSIYADRKHVQLIRGDKRQVVDCNRLRSHPGEDVKVMPGDNIQVPQSWY